MINNFDKFWIAVVMTVAGFIVGIFVAVFLVSIVASVLTIIN